jgi:hypothetical protein
MNVIGSAWPIGQDRSAKLADTENDTIGPISRLQEGFDMLG